VDLLDRLRLVLAAGNCPCPLPGQLWQELERRNVLLGSSPEVCVSDHRRHVAVVLKRLRGESGQGADVLVVAPSAALSRHLPFKNNKTPPCSGSWARWALAKKTATTLRVLLPSWKRLVTNIRDVIPPEEELALAQDGDQRVTVRDLAEWEGFERPRYPDTIFVCRSGTSCPPTLDYDFLELVAQAGAKVIRDFGETVPALLPRRWDDNFLSEKTRREIAALPRRPAPEPLPSSVIVEGRR
jgi:hypothetical protein